MANDTQSRKWQLTINNPVEKGFTHDRLKEILSEMKSVIFYCMADEIGEEGTYHTHVYIHSKNGVRFSTLKKKFDGSHIVMVKGTAQENMEYITKTGKWKNNKKAETSVEGTYEEWGEMPIERQGCRNDIADLYGMVKDGLSDYQILEMMPESLTNLDKLDRVRQILIQEEYKETFRNLEVTYIYGDSGSGKTRSVMEKYGYSNVFRVTDYTHPFDNYKGQDVVVFEEFRSSFNVSDMLNYLDGYPVELPCRYNNKFACFTKVYIVTNIPLTKQYPVIQHDHPSTWLAFLRRIHKVVQHKNGSIVNRKMVVTDDDFQIVDDTPFDE